jgi:hypothetical protein
MSVVLMIFIAIALLMMGLLVWAIYPVRNRTKSAEQLLDLLSEPRHYYRLPQILLCLEAKDTEFLIERNYSDLARQVRKERNAIALQFLDSVEDDYRELIETSRVLTAMAPEVVAVEEWQRLRLNMRFSWNCMMLRFRLRTGLTPWRGFSKLSDMASQLSYRLEVAVDRIGERSALTSEFPSPLN